MKFTYNWLLTHLSASLTINEIIKALENLSIEIDHTIKIGGKGYVVGKITHLKPYGEKLKIAEVTYTDNNEKFTQEVICGAPNLIKNMYTILALENTTLPNGMILKSKVINGFTSKGMCVSYEEFGLTHLHNNGIIHESENFLQELIKEDYIINISIPANRIDISSIYGLAIEIANYYKINLTPLIKENTNYNLPFSTNITCDENIASNLSFLEVNNISIKNNYEKITSLLCKISGLNPVPLVNIGTFITKDLGVPLHMYDKDYINNLHITLAEYESNFLTLQNETIIIKKEDIVIKNNNEIILLAGLIGGDKFKIKETTKNLIIEGGIFNKKHLIPTSNRLNIRTDSSYFFKRGINYNNYLLALHYLQNFIDGDFSKINNLINTPKIITPIFLSYKEFYEKTHVALSLEAISKKLQQYKYTVEIYNKPTEDLNNEMGLLITPPLYKCHIDSSASVVEDIIRISDGNIVREKIRNFSEKNKENSEIFYENIFKIKEYLVHMGLTEIITYSFSEKGGIELVNPIVIHEKFLRNTLTYHMEKYIKNLIQNKTYMESKYGGFEISKVFHKTNEIIEYTNLSIGFLKNTYHYGNNIENYIKTLLVNMGIIGNIKIELRHMTIDKNQHINKMEIYINNSGQGYIEFFTEYIICEIKNLESILSKEIKTKPRVYEDDSIYTIRDYSFFTNLNYSDIEKVLYKIKNISFCLLDIFTQDTKTSYTIKIKTLNKDIHLKEKEILDTFNKLNVVFR